MSKIKLISAVSRNGIIGKNNTLIWKLRKDLAWFKKQTLNTVMIMGRSTFESLPSLLPNREHWILSRTMNIQPMVE
ncbi:dihydrofolate reductase [Tenacibaculum phage PTm1]|uniref:dihydrofolate reductase n=2 Tax=Shirahamavirus PTm1 TaxID=2846435 RepID=A0A5S9BZ55_9CAUD|nr:dihydrofolate reductase [Tenacibaculum phage PTm1]BBI90621.1 dihydrofolate reductase [Tenacibaculum phage PTm1]BBI90927.1 dihydrofolate reductase [Tenacibaculum phage PTm5]